MKRTKIIVGTLIIGLLLITIISSTGSFAYAFELADSTNGPTRKIKFTVTHLAADENIDPYHDPFLNGYVILEIPYRSPVTYNIYQPDQPISSREFANGLNIGQDVGPAVKEALEESGIKGIAITGEVETKMSIWKNGTLVSELETKPAGQPAKIMKTLDFASSVSLAKSTPPGTMRIVVTHLPSYERPYIWNLYVRLQIPYTSPITNNTFSPGQFISYQQFVPSVLGPDAVEATKAAHTDALIVGIGARTIQLP